MNKPVIEGISREKTGKNAAKKIRAAGYIPAVVYDNTQNKVINVSREDMLEALKKQGDSALVEIKMGPSIINALIKEVQRDPVSEDLLHVDFKPVDMNKIVHTKVPVKFTGNDMLKRQGGVIQSQKSEIEVEGKPDSLPKSVNIDVSKFNLGDSIKVSDVEIAGEISIVSRPDEVIATIANTRSAEVPDIEHKLNVIGG